MKDDGTTINIGLMGLGTVGGGVAAALLDNAAAITRKTGRQVNLRRILVRDLARPRQPAPPPGILTTNPEDILSDPEIQVVIETMGGDSPAGEYLERALASGKHIVTANKEVMARRGPALLALAQSQQVNLLFEAAAGGGIPIVGCLMSHLLANDIRSIRSIINGTTNYILTQMAQRQTPFAAALAEAQARGYAEADPANDIEGIDAAYKLSVLGSLAFHRPIPHDAIYTEGISRLAPEDFRYAAELGYAIKSLAIAVAEPGGPIQARVHPALIPDDRLLAKVDGVYNAVEVTGDLCGQIILHGPGAGRAATTSAVMGDVLNIARGMSSAPAPPPLPETGGAAGDTQRHRQHRRPVQRLLYALYLRRPARRAGTNCPHPGRRQHLHRHRHPEGHRPRQRNRPAGGHHLPGPGSRRPNRPARHRPTGRSGQPQQPDPH